MVVLSCRSTRNILAQMNGIVRLAEKYVAYLNEAEGNEVKRELKYFT
jgi:hypothetical protein